MHLTKQKTMFILAKISVHVSIIVKKEHLKSVILPAFPFHLLFFHVLFILYVTRNSSNNGCIKIRRVTYPRFKIRAENLIPRLEKEILLSLYRRPW